MKAKQIVLTLTMVLFTMTAATTAKADLYKADAGLDKIKSNVEN